MDIFGIGGWELLLIAIIAMVVLGPERMLKHSFEAGRWLRKLSAYSRDALAMLEAQAREIDDGSLVDATKSLSDLKALGTELQTMGTKLISGTVSDIKSLSDDLKPILALTDSAVKSVADPDVTNAAVEPQALPDTNAIASRPATELNGAAPIEGVIPVIAAAITSPWSARIICPPTCCGPECLLISRSALPPLSALIYRSARPHLQ